jgi:hypothetical protein
MDSAIQLVEGLDSAGISSEGASVGLCHLLLMGSLLINASPQDFEAHTSQFVCGKTPGLGFPEERA